MLRNSIHNTMFRGIILNRLMNYVQSLASFDNPLVVAVNHHSHRYMKTCPVVMLSKISNTKFVEADEIFPEKEEQEVGITETALKERILNSLSEYPNLTQVSVPQLNNFLRNLCVLGFSVEDGLVMANKCCSIVGRNYPQLLQTVECFRRCKFSDGDIVSILRLSPEHLNVDAPVIVSRYNTLRQEFSHKSVKYIFSNCPHIGLTKWKVIQNKMEYLRRVMNVSSHEIAQSTALDCPLSVIKTRHLFLERAGLYKKPNPKSSVPSTNLRLSKIIDTEDEYFASETAGLTSEEYFVFQELLSLETDEGDSDDDVENI